jgi:hypothetical protein
MIKQKKEGEASTSFGISGEDSSISLRSLVYNTAEGRFGLA